MSQPPPAGSSAPHQGIQQNPERSEAVPAAPYAGCALPGPDNASRQTLEEADVTPKEKTNPLDEEDPEKGDRQQQQPREDDDAEEDEEEPGSLSADPDKQPYPEGGVRGWLVVVGSLSGMIACFGLMNSIGVFQAYVASHQLKNYSESSVGWIFSMYTFLSFFCGIQIGPIFDAKGPRWLVAAGSALLIACMLLLGVCTEYWHFMLVFGVLGGLGTSLIFTPAISSIGHFFLVKRGNATGIASTGGSIGGVIIPLMLQQLFPKVGWAWATRILGFIFIFLCVIANLFIRSRLPPKRNSSVLPDFTIFKRASFTLATAGVFFMEWGLFIPLSYLSSFAVSTGAVETSFSYKLIAILNAGSFVGRYAPGLIADKVGRYNCMIAALVFCVATSTGLWIPASALSATASPGTIKGLTIAFGFLFGVASGSNISLTPVCISQLCSTQEYGRYYATCYTIVSFGTLTGIPVGGALISACGGSYYGTAIFTSCCYTAALISFTAARVIKAGWSLRTKF